MNGFLSDPRVTFDREEGRIVSAYIELREGIKATHAVQPNKSALVYFFIAADGLPIGIRLLEPVSGVAVCEIVSTLIEGPDGPEGVDSTARHDFLTSQDLKHVVRGLKRSLEEMSAT